MGSIIGHRIDYNGVGALRGQRHIPTSRAKTPNKTCNLCMYGEDLSEIEGSLAYPS